MGDGTKENPYTRDDVQTKILANGGITENLDFSEKVFEPSIDLRGLNNNCLQGIILEKAIFPMNSKRSKKDCPFRGANLRNVHLEGANLRSIQLEEADISDAYLNSTNMVNAHLERANLDGTELGNAILDNAHLQGVSFFCTKFSAETGLETVDWGNYFLYEAGIIAPEMAVDTYRRLKVWYINAGYRDTAAKFYFSEREASRKYAKRRRDRIAGWLSWAVFGHGEGWKRIIFWILGIVLFFAIIYDAIGTLEPNRFLDSLYYSAVSFVAIGYGSWVKEAFGLVRYLGVCETFLGFFMMTLLLTTFVRKWSR